MFVSTLIIFLNIQIIITKSLGLSLAEVLSEKNNITSFFSMISTTATMDNNTATICDTNNTIGNYTTTIITTTATTTTNNKSNVKASTTTTLCTFSNFTNGMDNMNNKICESATSMDKTANTMDNTTMGISTYAIDNTSSNDTNTSMNYRANYMDTKISNMGNKTNGIPNIAPTTMVNMATTIGDTNITLSNTSKNMGNSDIIFNNSNISIRIISNTTSTMENITSMMENTTSTMENTTSSMENTTSTKENTTRMMENITCMMENTTRTMENKSSTMENTTGYIVSATGSYFLNTLTIQQVVFYCVIYPPIIIVGSVGNIMTLLILHQLNEKTSFAQYLFSLAISDTLTILIRSMYMIYVWGLFSSLDRTVLSIFEFLLVGSSILTQRISKMTTVCIVIERVVAVYHPFRAKQIITTLRVKIVIVSIYIIIFVSSLPSRVYGIVFDLDSKSKVTESPLAQGNSVELRNANHYRTPERDSLSAFNRIMFDFLPVLIVICCNLAIIIGLRRKTDNSAQSATHTSRQEKERKLTRLLLSISFCFLILCGPSDLFALFVITGIINLSPENIVIIEVFKVTNLLNCSINFIFYVLMNENYRQKFVEKNFCKRLRKDRETREVSIVDSSSIFPI